MPITMPRDQEPARGTVIRLARHWHGQYVLATLPLFQHCAIIALDVAMVLAITCLPGGSMPWASMAHGKTSSRFGAATGPGSWPMPQA